MKRKFFVTVILAMVCCLSLTGCGSKVREEAMAAVEAYNAQVEAYNEGIIPYNEAVGSVVEANDALVEAVNKAQEVIDQGGQPLDPKTLETLNESMSMGQGSLVEVPAILDTIEPLSINEDMKSSELKALTEEANTGIQEMSDQKVPDIPETPDYSELIEAIQVAQNTFEESIKSLEQVTAPSDAFVMERLQGIDTITMMDAVTEEHDPNGRLGKQGGYIGCIYFRDSQVDQSQLYVDGDPNDVIDVGTDGGGALEIFSSVEDAQARDAYLAQFDGTPLVSGSHQIVGTILVRTSDELTATQQTELTDKIIEALTFIDE